jgi:hypothetical protein
METVETAAGNSTSLMLSSSTITLTYLNSALSSKPILPTALHPNSNTLLNPNPITRTLTTPLPLAFSATLPRCNLLLKVPLPPTSSRTAALTLRCLRSPKEEVPALPQVRTSNEPFLAPNRPPPPSTPTLPLPPYNAQALPSAPPTPNVKARPPLSTPANRRTRKPLSTSTGLG